MYDSYIYASYGVTAVLLLGLVIVSVKNLFEARRRLAALENASDKT
ncbi:MAG: heme exporter protein CcmD [Parvibaculales bacterium]